MNHISKIIISTIILTGCDEARIYGGLGSSDAAEGSGWEHENPIGFFRGEANTYLTNGLFIGTFGQHTSSASTGKDKTGLNYLGVHGGYTWGGRP